MADEDSRKIYCGNLSDEVTEELLYELFLQVAPLVSVRIPKDQNGKQQNFAFIVVRHEESVDYVVQILQGTSLFGKKLIINPRKQQNDLRNKIAQPNIGRPEHRTHPSMPPVYLQNPLDIYPLMQMGHMMNANHSLLGIDNYTNFNDNYANDYGQNHSDNYKDNYNDQSWNNKKDSKYRKHDHRNERNNRYNRRNQYPRSQDNFKARPY